MENRDFKQFHLLYDDIRQDLETLRERSSELSTAIGSGKLVSDAMAERLMELLRAYRDRLTLFRREGEALSIPLEGGLSEIAASLAAAEETARLASERNAVLDYFRLTANEEDVQAALEASKRLLMERCRASETLEPFLLTIQKVQAKEGRPTYAELNKIAKGIDPIIALALQGGDLSVDRDAPVDRYLDGSCAALSAESGPLRETPIDTPQEAETPSAPASDTPEPVDAAAPTEALWSDFDGYAGAAEVTFTDVPAKQLGASKFLNMARQKPESVKAIFQLAHQILLEESDLADEENHYGSPSGEIRNLLLRQGYFMELTLRSTETSRTFLTLTSKGWACFKKAETAKYLRTHRMIPSALRLTVSELTPKNVLRLALLHDYYSHRTLKLNYLLFPNTRERFYLAEHFDDGEGSRLAAAAIFEAGDEARDLQALQSVIDELEDEDALRIIVYSKEDLLRLDPQLDFSSVRKEQVSYCLHGQPETVLDHDGEPRSEEQPEAEALPEVPAG